MAGNQVKCDCMLGNLVSIIIVCLLSLSGTVCQLLMSFCYHRQNQMSNIIVSPTQSYHCQNHVSGITVASLLSSKPFVCYHFQPLVIVKTFCRLSLSDSNRIVKTILYRCVAIITVRVLSFSKPCVCYHCRSVVTVV